MNCILYGLLGWVGLSLLFGGYILHNFLTLDKYRPDFKVGGAEPYLLRWYLLPRNRWFNVYYHVFLRSDEDRALHDHMYVNVSIVLTGGYWEHRADGSRRWIKPGSILIRRPTTAHRIELESEWYPSDLWKGPPVSASTLFITGPRVREWGFHCPKGWRHWKDFVSKEDPGARGRGCDDEEPAPVATDCWLDEPGSGTRKGDAP